MEPRNRLNEDESDVNLRIVKVRGRGDRLVEEFITSAHGAGGKATSALISQIFVPGYGNEVLEQLADGAVMSLDALGATDGASLAFTTDSYVVSPIRFPGGSIGDLAVNGTVNDLAVSGAIPQVLSAGFIIEEGLPVEELKAIVADMRDAAATAGVRIVTGDTKVVPKDSADKVFINTSGVGLVPAGRAFGANKVRRGDKVICSGPIADHGMSVMLARGDLAIDAPIESDSRAINHLVEALIAAVPETRWMRDVTRGGLATVLNELAEDSGFGVAIEDENVPVRDMTRAACDILGIDPLYVANEGMFTAIVPGDQANVAVEALQALPGGEEAAVIGRIVPEPASSVVLVTGFGGTRMVDKLVGDPLPRIC